LKLLRRGAIAFSLANLCYLQSWLSILAYSKSDSFLMKSAPNPAQYLALMTAVLLQALLLFLLATLAARINGHLATLGRLVFLLILVIPLEHIRAQLLQVTTVFGHEFLRTTAPSAIVNLPVVLAVILLLWNRARWESRLVQAASSALVACAPLALLTFGGAVYKIATANPKPFENHPTASWLAVQKDHPRVILALFDEWDYRLTFEDRKAGVSLPNLDRLRQSALFATNAHSPKPATIFSVPALLTGEDVADVRPVGVSRLDVRLEGQKSWASLAQFPTLFTRAREAGVNAAAFGWYLPYCRLFSKDLVSCDWNGMELQYNSKGVSFGAGLVNEPRSLLEFKLHSGEEVAFWSIFGQALATEHRVRTYAAEQTSVLEEAANNQLGLLYVHYPLPHSPYFYDTNNGTFDLNTTKSTGYLQNLALVDKSVGELRRRLEESGLWNTTTVLLMTDHSSRASVHLDGKTDPRIPFILKMAGSDEGIQVDFPFNSLLTGDLVLAILEKRVSTPQDAARWIAAHAEKQPPTLRARTFK